MNTLADSIGLRVIHGWVGDAFDFAPVQAALRFSDEDRITGYLDSQSTSWLPALLHRLEADLGITYPIVAFQGYRNGSGTEWHTDSPFDEQAILSLGVTRTFAIRRNGSEYEKSIPLHHGDLVVMPSGFQDEFEHRVVPDDSTGERISLVFRTPKG